VYCGQTELQTPSCGQMLEPEPPLKCTGLIPMMRAIRSNDKSVLVDALAICITPRLLV
jgi:hypothetical protein